MKRQRGSTKRSAQSRVMLHGLGLDIEPEWTCTREFVRLWEGQFATFTTWQACKRRQLYKENYMELGRAGKGLAAWRRSASWRTG